MLRQNRLMISKLREGEKDSLRSVRCVFVPILQQVFDLRYQQTTSIVKLFFIIVEYGSTRGIVFYRESPGPSFKADASSSSVKGRWRSFVDMNGRCQALRLLCHVDSYTIPNYIFSIISRVLVILAHLY